MISEQNKNFSFEQYREKILGIANETFGSAYRYVFKQYWHNNVFTASMARSYNITDWQNGTFETYVPTSEHMSHGLNYYRIVIKVLPEIDWETSRNEAIKLTKPQITPAGYNDSELFILISPKLKKRGFIRAFQHTKKKGYLTTIWIDPQKQVLPLWHKILQKIISPFIEKRLRALYESLDMQPYQYDHIELKRHYYILNNIITNFSYSLGLVVKSFSHFLNFLDQKMRYIRGLMGNDYLEKEMLRHIEPLNNTLRMDFLRRVKAELEKSIVEVVVKPEKDKDLAYLEVLARR